MNLGMDLFDSVVADARLHPAFRALRDSKFHGEARTLMNSLHHRMGDTDGNFLADFQGDGFQSRLFEIACLAYLESAGMTLDRSHHAPDFLASRDGICVAVEATTANPTSGREADISLRQMGELSEAEIKQRVDVDFPRRMSTILKRKRERRYHELEQGKGRPLVLMVAPLATFPRNETIPRTLMAVTAKEKRVEVIMVHGRRNA